VRRRGALDGDGHLLLASLHLRGGRDAAAAASIDAAFAGETPPSTARATGALRETIDRKAWDLAALLDERLGEPPPEADADAASTTRRTLTRLRARMAIESGADPEAGVRSLEELLAADPLDGVSLLVLGRQRVADGRSDDGELLLERATRCADVAHDAWLELARLRVAQHHYNEALAAIEEALALRQSQELTAYRDALAALAEAAE